MRCRYVSIFELWRDEEEITGERGGDRPLADVIKVCRQPPRTRSFPGDIQGEVEEEHERIPPRDPTGYPVVSYRRDADVSRCRYACLMS